VRLDLAVMMVAGTLALVGLVAAAVVVVRNRLADDPDLRDFMDRVERGRPGGDVEAGDPENGSSAG